jgi:ribosomal protein S18 acetylase RimI-like enzyme
MEGVFGAGFADVRVHVGNEATSIGALAFTHGSDVYFAPGRYQPNTTAGLRLIGHELTHVVQQRSGRVRNPFGSGVAVVQDAALEAEADRMGATAAPIRAKLAAVGSASRPNSATVVIGGPGPVRNGRQKIEARVSGYPGSVGSVELVPAGSDRLKIINLKVDPDHRRRSIGTRLVTAALQAARRRGAANVVLEARPTDSSISLPSLVKMYTGLGFRHAGISSRGAAVMQRCTGGSVRDAAFQTGDDAARSPRHAVQAKLLSGSVYFKTRHRGLTSFGPAVRPLQLTPHSRLGPAGHCRCGRVNFFHHVSGGTIQRADDDDYPHTPPPTPAQDPYGYFASGMEYHVEHGDMDSADLWEAKVEKHGGKTIGQSYGTQESEDYDASYVDIPEGHRPAAPKALWKLVYGGLTPKFGDPTREVITCQELCGKTLEVDANTKCEIGTNRRPPMCHIRPYNHIKWAVQWIHDNNTHASAKKYKGPDVKGMDADAFKELVWDLSNLRPGHSTCNSKTASSAVGVPKTSDQAGIIQYVVGKLKVLRANWF